MKRYLSTRRVPASVEFSVIAAHAWREVAADCLDTLLARGARLDAATEQTCREAFLATLVSDAPIEARGRVGSTDVTTSGCGACQRIPCWDSSRSSRVLHHGN
jgi:hypothetical protein